MTIHQALVLALSLTMPATWTVAGAQKKGEQPSVNKPDPSAGAQKKGEKPSVNKPQPPAGAQKKGEQPSVKKP